MASGSSVKRRYLVMPARRMAGPVMQTAVFQQKTAASLTETFQTNIEPFLAGPAALFGAARPAHTGLAKAIEDQDFEVLSQRFEDGPATVAMTDAARLALEAGNPNVRVLPITRYTLPGERQGGTASVRPAAETAVDGAGRVFMKDLKQRLLDAAPPSAGGTGVVIALLDTGVDAAHPALQGRLAGLKCFIPNADPHGGGPVNWAPAAAARAGHGTHVAGIVAANDGAGGPPGVAPNARLISYRIFPDNPKGLSSAENPVIIDSIRGAIEDGCQVINLSIEGPTLKEDGVRTAIGDAWDNGVLCIAAAGNGFGNPVSYPAALAQCIAVTAIGRDETFPDKPNFKAFISDQRATSDNAIFLARFSNYGPQVQFAAPGHAIVSTFPGGNWWFNSGTSMAAPFIAGLLARLLSDRADILGMKPDANRSAAMLQMLVGRARMLGLPQVSQEGYGLPI